MRSKELYEIIDRVAPFRLSREMTERYGHYDNSGLLLDFGREIEGVLFSLDLSPKAVEQAKRARANCIVTHHPAIWQPINRINEEVNGTLAACLKEGISVISAHLNLDAAKGGIDEWLMRGLGGKNELAVYETLTDGAYGRVYDVAECSLERFAEKTALAFHTKRMTVYGASRVRRVASFCGAGMESGIFSFAKANGADTIVSSDPKHHLITQGVEEGFNLMILTHYAAENHGFVRFAEHIKRLIQIPVSVFTDERYL